MKRLFSVFCLLLLTVSAAFGQANGKLQLHFIDVGQGDAAVLISPKGEVVMFDNGIKGYCDKPLSYLDQLGIKKIDYHVASHYHADHVSCTSETFATFAFQKTAYDRGPSTTAIYKIYAKAVGKLRKTASKGERITLDQGTNNPVIIEFVAANGAGVKTTNENDLSLVAAIHFGKFDAVMGGDLSGFNQNEYKDIESNVAKDMKQVEVYKVHHHGSRYSSNEKWLSTIKPKVGIISASANVGTNYKHPTKECLTRLHRAGIKTYWTEKGGGVAPDPAWDTVGGNIVVEAEPNGNKFTVTYNWSKVDSYPMWETASTSTTKEETAYAWSKKSGIYHYSNCKYVSNIDPANLVTGEQPPAGKTMHTGCPR